MPQTIWKYLMKDRHGERVIHVPEGARIVDMQNQGEYPAIYYACDPDRPLTPRRIRVVVTGEMVNDPDEWQYVATAMFFGGQFVAHLYVLREVVK